MKSNLILATALIAAFAAAGCSSRGAKPLPPPSDAVDVGGSSGGVTPQAIDKPVTTDPSPIATKPATGPGYDLTAKVIYFPYDSAEIDTAGQGVIANHGKYLTGTSTAKIRLEGHTDERGSVEYNIALAERRAQTVASELKALGVTDAQLSIVSYGKERPATPGTGEDVWAKNRRVEIKQP